MHREACRPLRTAAAFALVAAVTLACFLPALRNGLLAWDDAGYITDNVHIRSLSLETVGWAFTTFHCNYWAPLTWLSLAVDHAVWGLDPVGYHLTNAVLHALSAGLFFLVSLRLLRRHVERAREAGRPTWLTEDRALATAALAALLFGVHPLRVESVAWATERKDVLSLFFGLLALLAFLAHARAGDAAAKAGRAEPILTRAYGLSLALYALSLLAKSLLVTLPAVLLVLDAFPLRRLDAATWRRRVLEKAPFLVLAAAQLLFAARGHAPWLARPAQVDVPTRVLVAFEALVRYLGLTLVPVNVSPAYLHPGNAAGLGASHLLSIGAVLAVTAACVASARRQPVLLATWALYGITVAPFLGLSPIGPQSMAGRFTYVPGMALALLAALGLVALHARLERAPAARRGLVAATLAILACNGYLTIRDIGWWRDDVALWTRAIDLDPHAVGKAYFGRALAYRARGEHQRALDDLDEAARIAARKGYAAAHEIVAARARVLRDMGDLDGAIAEFSRAIASSRAPDAHGYRWERGTLYRLRGEVALADEDFRAAAAPP